MTNSGEIYYIPSHNAIYLIVTKWRMADEEIPYAILTVFNGQKYLFTTDRAFLEISFYIGNLCEE